ncbi:MAG TPA: pilus assembly protein PilP [Myxococcaceae bacterium]|jgi:Tfp pilus assembly protein PilP
MKTSLAVLCFGVLLSGCSTQVPAPPARPTAPPPVAEAPAPSAHVPEPEVAYSYFPKRDPFGGPVRCCRPPPPDACLDPLCRYNLEELTLAGVISGTSNPVAVIESPRGKGYSVYPGSKVGKRGGVVKQVLRDAIVVAEPFEDGQGLTRHHETILQVKPDMPLELDE